MVVCDSSGQPLGFSLHAADTHEIKCVEDVLESIPTKNLPQKIFGDKAYDAQNVQHGLNADWGLILYAPLRKNNKQIVRDSKDEIDKKNRWKIERLISWLKNFRRVNMRWEYHPENFLSWVFLAATLIAFNRF
jgi:hypothetical protein